MATRGSQLGFEGLTVWGEPSDFFATSELSYNDGPFGQAEKQTLDAYRPHLARAALMATRLELQRAEATVSTLSVLGLPGAVVNRAGRVVAANAQFETLAPRVIIGAFDAQSLADPAQNSLLLKGLLTQKPHRPAERAIVAAGLHRCSRLTFERPPFVQHVAPAGEKPGIRSAGLAILAETGLPASRLELELSESALVRDLPAAKEMLGALRTAGIRLALDDFGTGYSSFYHLRNFPVDRIKIDRSFVEKITSEAESSELVRAMLGLGKGLGFEVTAEGIENPAQLAALLSQGCNEGQGFLFSVAIPAADAAALLSRPGRAALQAG